MMNPLEFRLNCIKNAEIKYNLSVKASQRTFTISKKNYRR